MPSAIARPRSPGLRFVAAALGVLAAASSLAGSPVAAGYREAVFSVSDAAAWTDFFATAAGWEVLHDGPADDALLGAWELPEAAAAREIVVGNPGTERGFVRLIEFSGVGQRQIRSNAQSWDTGGFFDVNSRVLSMTDKFAELQRRDWQAASDPVRFTFGPFVVKEWLARGPDGIVFALIERIEPPLDGHPQLRDMGRLFNATQIVADIEAARDFYMNKLGFRTYLDHSGPSRAPGPNVLGLPHNLATAIPRHVSILSPDGDNEGSIELLQFDGATGADFSARAVPPNLGIVMLRFPVDDMTAFAEHVADEGVEVAMAPIELELPPYGRSTLMAIRGPGGVWLEFFETIE